MSLQLIITVIACLAIGFYAGLNFTKSRYIKRITALHRQIDDLQDENEDLRNPQPKG